jgi:nitroreductase
MVDFMEIIKGRRSIRKFQAKEIQDEDLNTVLEAVRWAPSWSNTQCWEVIVVKDSRIKEELQDSLTPRNPAREAILEAPIVCALCGKLEHAGYKRGEPVTKFGDWFMFDVGIATQNLCLTAHTLNMGTVIVGALDQDKAGAILGVPDGYTVAALVPIGYPAQEAKAPARREISEFVHYDRF